MKSRYRAVHLQKEGLRRRRGLDLAGIVLRVGCCLMGLLDLLESMRWRVLQGDREGWLCLIYQLNDQGQFHAQNMWLYMSSRRV